MAINLAISFTILFGLLFQDIDGQDSERYRCPSHLTRDIYLKAYNNKCYRFDKTEMYWTTARDTCAGEQGHLIEIRNLATQNWVVSTLNDLSWSTNGVWIGAHDIDENDVWTWVTGDTLTWNYWASGQPNCNWFCVEYCANLRRDDNGRWHDKHCEAFYSTYSYICQYDMGPATTTTSQPSTAVISTSTESTSEADTTTVSTTESLTTVASTSALPTSTTPGTPSVTPTSSTTTKVTASTTRLTTSQNTTTVSMTTTTTVVSTTSTNNQSHTDLSQDEDLKSGALSGVVVACVLGAIALALIGGVCFYKSRKKKGEDSLAVYFDNIIYTVRTGESRMRGHQQNLNNQVPAVNQNDYADINECAGSSRSPPSKGKEANQYSEIADLTNLSVQLPKFDNEDYLKCNIAKSKLGNKDTNQYLDVYEGKQADKKETPYLDACEGNGGFYESATEEVCNSMNEQLESNRNCYDECGNVERGDNSPSHYVDLENIKDSTDDASSHQSPSDQGIYEECANRNEHSSDINDIWHNFNGTLDLSKTVSGYNNNTYNIKTE